MAIVSISRGANSRGRGVAELVANRLACKCLAREDVIKGFDLTDIPEHKIIQALEDPPSFLKRLLGDRIHYITSARAALLSQLTDDDVVYHGFSGHYFLKDVPQALKVRVLADLSDRVTLVANRDGISHETARAHLTQKDEARRQWALRVYGVDPEDPSLYDIVLHVGKMGTNDVAGVIFDLAQNDAFKLTEASRMELSNLALAASVETVLIDMEIDVNCLDIDVQNGDVIIHLHETRRTRAGSSSEFRKHYVESLRHRLHDRTRLIPGLKAVHLEHAVD